MQPYSDAWTLLLITADWTSCIGPMRFSMSPRNKNVLLKAYKSLKGTELKSARTIKYERNLLYCHLWLTSVSTEILPFISFLGTSCRKILYLMLPSSTLKNSYYRTSLVDWELIYNNLLCLMFLQKIHVSCISQLLFVL